MTGRKKEEVKKKKKKKKNVTGKSFLVLRRNTSLRKRLFWNPAWRWLLFLLTKFYILLSKEDNQLGI